MADVREKVEKAEGKQNKTLASKGTCDKVTQTGMPQTTTWKFQKLEAAPNLSYIYQERGGELFNKKQLPSSKRPQLII